MNIALSCTLLSTARKSQHLNIPTGTFSYKWQCHRLKHSVDRTPHVLVQAGYTRRQLLCLEGASAGGWLVCAALNQQPDPAAAVVLTVPCCDVLTALVEGRQGVLELGDPDDKEVR